MNICTHIGIYTYIQYTHVYVYITMYVCTLYTHTYTILSCTMIYKAIPDIMNSWGSGLSGHLLSEHRGPDADRT